MLWGLSPALDLLSEFEKVTSLFGLNEVNILLIGSTDARHLMKTMSALRRHPVEDAKVNFFVMDLAIDFVARQLLLLTIALEPENRLGPLEKARLWMEVYGNTLIRPVTARYVMSKAVQLTHMVTNKEFLKKRLPIVNLDQVKYKEIDQMEKIFKYWAQNRLNIAKVWDIKLRKSLGTRYDAKFGAFDWDYSMKLREIEDAQRVCSSEYKMWRNTGQIAGKYSHDGGAELCEVPLKSTRDSEMLWGLSPALDLVADLKKIVEVKGDSVVNILLIGSTDARHILKTISLRKRHSANLKVNFFVMDTSPELVVRQILLLTIALEPKQKLGPMEKSRLWMEVYGNTLVRSSTAKYVIHKMGQIRRMATDREFLMRRMPLIDLSLLRYLDIDDLEEAARYYQDNRRYLISKIWDYRLRERLETDYDHRFNVFDWDYTTALSLIPGGHRVCSPEYVFWRNTGIAFTWLETEFAVGNPTLAVCVGSLGDTLFSHGYMGDMESGPFFAFGTDSEEKKMLECRNGTSVRRATDITERNLQRLFHELEHGSPPNDLYAASIDMGLVKMKPGNVDVDKEVQFHYEPDRTPEDYSAIPVPNCSVVFLPGNAMQLYPNKSKYKEFFDIIFVAQNFFQFLNADIMSMAKPNGCLVVETRKFVIGIQKEIGKFGKEVRGKLQEIGWEEVTKCHFKKDDHAVFRKSKGGPQSKEDISNPESEEEQNMSTKLGKNKISVPNAEEKRLKDNQENLEESDLTNLKETGEKQLNLNYKEDNNDMIHTSYSKELSDSGRNLYKNATSEEREEVSGVRNQMRVDIFAKPKPEIMKTLVNQSEHSPANTKIGLINTSEDETSKSADIPGKQLPDKRGAEKTDNSVVFREIDRITTDSENLTNEILTKDAQSDKDREPDVSMPYESRPEDIKAQYSSEANDDNEATIIC